MVCKRERISWRPEWNNDFIKWSKYFLIRNKWRTDPIHELDDLIQDAYLTFLHLANTYPRVVDEGHFMALFKQAMKNKMHDRSCHYTRRKNTVEAPITTDDEEVFSGRMGEMTNSGFLACLLDEAPDELKTALAMLADGSLDETGKRNVKPNVKTRVIGAFDTFWRDKINELKEFLA